MRLENFEQKVLRALGLGQGMDRVCAVKKWRGTQAIVKRTFGGSVQGVPMPYPHDERHVMLARYMNTVHPSSRVTQLMLLYGERGITQLGS